MSSIQEYFRDIDENLAKCYEVASQARKKGYDPVDYVEIPLAANMAERVEGLISAVAPQIGGSGVVQRIHELEKQYGALDWRVALTIALEVAQQKFCKFKDEREAMEVGIRVGFAYATVGVVASPLEGFVELKIRNRRDGKKYFALMYSGPVRSAGGTGASVSVLIADYVRKQMGYEVYDITEEEIKRNITEVYDYHEKVTNLQYYPSEEELRFLLKNLPVQIDGDPSEKYEVSNYKDLKRIETNTIRNGPCLVLAECLAQKAKKVDAQLKKWGKDFDMKHWSFLEEFLEIQKKSKAKGEEGKEKIKPDYTFINDLVGGRPVLTHPLKPGGFRLRYGRCRNSGFSSDAIHPASMAVMSDFVAIGTQLKMERPGKATAIAVCDKIEGPTVRLRNGTVMLLDTEEKARKHLRELDEIIYLGDILINYGDFFNRAHRLVPCGYNEEWYKRELEKAGIKKEINSVEEAIKVAKQNKVPMHPRYTYHWKDITKKQLLSLLNWIKQGSIEKDRIVLPFFYDVTSDLEGADPKRALELLGIPHTVAAKENVIIQGDDVTALIATLGLDEFANVDEVVQKILALNKEDVLEIVNVTSGMIIRDKSGTFIGARMGRPEKAKMRELDGSPQVLFPVGQEGGKMRNFKTAIEKGKVTGDFPIHRCEKCNRATIYNICEQCGEKTKKLYHCPKCKKDYEEEECEEHGKNQSYKTQEIDIKYYFDQALKTIKTKNIPEVIKGVRGTSNKDHIPENLVKGILRAIHRLYVNKEGTIRYDMTETVLTHFKPKEIGTSIAKLKELGYETDIYGKKLENEEQILELKPQDVVLPGFTEGPEEGADKVLFRTSKFIDDLLVKLYGMKKFYNLKNEKDLVGHLVLGMSPHTSAGVVARIVGFSKTQGFMAHPLLHSLMRRDADGDEACVILLLDVLINFSRNYLPSHRGAVQDAPLVLSSRIIPSEVDDMVFDMDVVYEYPLELYEAAQEYKYPWEVQIEQLKHRLGTEKQYYDYGFTHDTTDINEGVTRSAYKNIPTMLEKIMKQVQLAEKIRAVDETDVARLVIEKHLLRDIRGNLRKFSMQEFRCVDCNQKYRRPPLTGRCKCGGRIIFTISHGSIIKYLEPSMYLAEKYSLPAYLVQTLELTKNRIESVFGKETEKQEGLGKWF
ncbi:MAG: DNA polymerase II large subunit [Candidatus Nanoarchaeia archaeon]